MDVRRRPSPDPYVRRSAWARYRREALAAFLILGVGNIYGFWRIEHERADRIDQAATVIRVRCEDSRANRQAIRVLLAAELVEDEEHRAAALRRLEAALAALPPVQDCDRQAREIRGLVD